MPETRRPGTACRRILGRWCCAWSASTTSARWPICRRSPSRRRGRWAPVAAGGVVLSRFCWRCRSTGTSSAARPTAAAPTGLLEDLIPGWRGKLVVLTLLGFAAADFVITRSLSVADAAVHLIHNPHGQRLLAHLPASLLGDDHALWPPLDPAAAARRPQVAITLGLSIVSFGLWQRAQARRQAANSARRGRRGLLLPRACRRW